MAWNYLIIAGLLEIVWAVGLRLSEGFTRPAAIAVTVVAMAGSIYYLAKALQEIPLGTGYAAWTGIGIAGTAIAGVVLFGEDLSPTRIGSMSLIVAGIAGLRFAS